MKKIQAGIVQFDVKTGKVEENLKTALKGIYTLADRGADLVVLPEMCTSGFDYKNLKNHAEKTPEILTIFKKTAKQKNIIIAASMPETDKGQLFNTLFLIEKNGELAGSYRKIHLFSLTDEHKNFSNGIKPVVCNTSAGRIGLMICYDLRFPELCRKLKDNGAEIVIVAAQWPKPRIEHWDVLIRARAIENQLFVVAANRHGKSQELDFPGHSQIISPWGKVLATAEIDTGLFTAQLNMDEIKEAAKIIPCLSERVYEAYQ